MVGLAGLAVLRLDDGTEISLAGETRIECHRQDGQTTVTLHEGHLSANVAPQAAGRPLLIHTPDAEMRCWAHGWPSVPTTRYRNWVSSRGEFS